MNDTQQGEAPKPRYRWPWFLLAALILAVVLAVLWMSVLVKRTRDYRIPDSAPASPAARPTSSL